MHIWDTFCIALHLDGLQCDFFLAPARKNNYCRISGSFSSVLHQSALEIHKVFLRAFWLALRKNLLLSAE